MTTLKYINNINWQNIFYIWAFLYIKIDNIKNTIFGIQLDKTILTLEFVAATVDSCKKKIYATAIKSPIAKWAPIPPLTFLDEILTPIKTKIKIEKGVEVL